MAGIRASVARNSVFQMAGDYVILTPVFDDWESCGIMLKRLDEVLYEHGICARVLAVDDGSNESPGDQFLNGNYRAFTAVDVLRLRRNLGHQRAIALGLAHTHAEIPCRGVVAMDADGEDDPRDVPRLLAACAAHDHKKIVFAERTRRPESLTFRFFYFLYRVIHRVLTGRGVRVGNFSVVPWARLRSLVAVAELWGHYAAAVICSRRPSTCIPTQRATRIAGHSKLRFVGLVTHGLSAIAIFSDVIGVRLLIASLGLAVLAGLGVLTTIAVRLFTSAAIPGWATYTTGILLVVMIQAVILSVVFIFVVLSGRRSLDFLPTRDFAHFVDHKATIYEKEAAYEEPWTTFTTLVRS